MRRLKLVAALSVAGAMSLASYVPAQAAPFTPLSVAAKPDVQGSDQAGGSVIQVQWRGGWRGGGWRGGAGAVAVAGAGV
jgi:hypothetical protein